MGQEDGAGYGALSAPGRIGGEEAAVLPADGGVLNGDHKYKYLSLNDSHNCL